MSIIVAIPAASRRGASGGMDMVGGSALNHGWRLISLAWWLFARGVGEIMTDCVWSDMYMMVRFHGGLHWPSEKGGVLRRETSGMEGVACEWCCRHGNSACFDLAERIDI